MATVTFKAVNRGTNPQVYKHIMPTENKESARKRAESFKLTKYKILKVE
jgi:hypothetical protein